MNEFKHLSLAVDLGDSSTEHRQVRSLGFGCLECTEIKKLKIETLTPVLAKC